MFDTMTITKAGGALCGSLLVFLLGNWAAESLYHVGGGHGGHGDEEIHQAYVIDIGADDAAEEEEVEAIDVASLMATADVGAGAKVFKKCAGCHKIEPGANGTGPSLYGVVGRAADSESSFGGYSGNLSASVDSWTAENLFHFLEDPKGFAPGNKMSFRGLPKPGDRANLIAYLDSLDG